MPKFVTVRPMNDTEKISVKDQKLFGMLLCIMRSSRPEIASVTQKLSKVMDGVNHVAFLELHQVIKYVLSSQKW